MLILWRDKTIVTTISNYYITGFVEKEKYEKTKKTIHKPRLIHEYSSNMHGVDKSDQLLSYYDFSRKTKNW